MTDHDHSEHAADGERVVVRDRRRIDPQTGKARNPDGTQTVPSGSDAAPPEPAEPAVDPASGVAAAELAAQVAERTADLQRLSAEYANYRRRVDRDREVASVNARVQLVSDLLTVLDDIERADAHGDLNGPFKAVADKLIAVVGKLGLEAFGLEGEPFDPSVHEAVQHEATDAAGPSVAVLSGVLRRGYRIADRVLRPAMVTVVDRVDDGTTAATGAHHLIEDDPAERP